MHVGTKIALAAVGVAGIAGLGIALFGSEPEPIDTPRAGTPAGDAFKAVQGWSQSNEAGDPWLTDAQSLRVANAAVEHARTGADAVQILTRVVEWDARAHVKFSDEELRSEDLVRITTDALEAGHSATQVIGELAKRNDATYREMTAS